MRNLVITQNITVDGAVEMLGDWFDPQFADDDLVAESHRQDAEAAGRRLFPDGTAFPRLSLVEPPKAFSSVHHAAPLPLGITANQAQSVRYGATIRR